MGNNFAFHYSTDGEHFYMMRYFHLPAQPVIKVGLLAQAPTGQGGVRGVRAPVHREEDREEHPGG